MTLLNFGAGIEAEVWIRPEDGAWSVLADGRVVQAGLSWGDALAVGEAIMRTCAGPHAPRPAPREEGSPSEMLIVPQADESRGPALH
jgi:hypothetical protein